MEESLKLGLVEQYVEGQDVAHILPHAWLPYLELTIKYGLMVFLLGFVSSFLASFAFFTEAFQWIMAIMGIMLFAKYIYDFLDKYLDTVILTDKGVTVVSITSWFRYKVDFFERKNIATVSFSQSGLVDRVFNEGIITISLDHDSDYIIEGVSRPQKQSSIINRLKFELLAKAQAAQEAEVALSLDQPDKFELLVDTLGDVINTYMRGGVRN